MSAKISVIVPVYNVEKYLERCLKSIINQTFKDIEIIVVNDGSTDNSPKICEYFALIDNRIKVIHKKNSGLGFARNSGLDAAQGEFIAFVDSDDYIEVNAFELLYNTAISEKCDIVYGGIYYNRGNKVIKKDCINNLKIWRNKNEINLFLLGLIGTMPENTKNTEYEVSVWKSLYRKDLFDKYSIKFVSEKEFISEDIIFDIDYIQHTSKIAMIPQCIYHYCINENSLCRIYRKDRFNKNIILYNELQRKLSYIFNEDEYKIRTDRFLITKARICINAICKSCDKCKNDSIMKILSNSQLEEVLSRYDINRLPRRLALFTKLMKNKNIFMIRLLSFIKNIL